MNEKKAFEHFLSLVPKDENFRDYCIRNDGKRKGFKYKMYSWLTGKSEDYYSYNMERDLKKVGFTFQIYFDIVVLKLSNINDRPRCPYCGKLCKFYNGRYSFTCGDLRCINMSYRRTRGTLTEEERFSTFLSLIPKEFDPDTVVKTIKTSKRTRYLYCMYSWLTGEETNRYVERPEKELLKLGFSPQLYYDLLILQIRSIKNRPCCPICGISVDFCGLKRGYKKTCSKRCWRQYRIRNPNDVLPTSDELRKRRSDNAVNFILSDRKIKGNSGRYDSVVFNCSFYYDSSWEKDFIVFMEKLFKKGYIKSFYRNRDAIEYFKPDGTIHKYLPDFEFYLDNGQKVVVEIKPKGFVEKDSVVKRKISAAKKYYFKRKIKYIVITEKELYKNNKGFFWIYDYVI